MTDHAICEVLISIAVSESGRSECCIADDNWIQQKRKHQEFIDEKRNDKQFWHIKTVKVNVPMPISYEDMVGDEK